MILVIDQDKELVALLNDKLHLPYRALRVSHGRRAIVFAKKGGIELILLSSSPPDIAGLEVLKILSQKAPSIPVIFVAHSSNKNLIVSAFRLGARDFIESPTNQNVLLESIHRVLGPSIEKGSDKPHPPIGFRPFRSKVSQFFTGLWQNPARKPQEQPMVSALDSAPKVVKKPVMPESSEPQSLPLQTKATQITKETTRSTAKEDERKTRENLKQKGQNKKPKLSIYYLGAFRAILNDQMIANWPGRKGKLLFAYLTANHKKHIYRDILMERFWPDSSLTSARNSLNVAMHHVRYNLHKVNPSFDHIRFHDECYYFNPEMDIWLDTEAFYEYWKIAKTTELEKGLEAAVERYEFALTLYKGAFMEEDLYENWPASERENFKEIYIVILDRLSKYYSLLENPSKAIPLCNAILDDDNCREDIHRRLMRCYYKMGQRCRALYQFRKCTEMLEKELEVKPTSGTIELYQQMKGNIYRFIKK